MNGDEGNSTAGLAIRGDPCCISRTAGPQATRVWKKCLHSQLWPGEPGTQPLPPVPTEEEGVQGVSPASLLSCAPDILQGLPPPAPPPEVRMQVSAPAQCRKSAPGACGPGDAAARKGHGSCSPGRQCLRRSLRRERRRERCTRFQTPCVILK